MHGRQLSQRSLLRGRWGTALLLACSFLGVLAALPAGASASFPWVNQEALRNETDPVLRSTYIIDAPPGTMLSRGLFLSQPYLGLYLKEGFDRNFLTWAPHTSVNDTYMASHNWTGCGETQVPVSPGFSYCWPAVKLNSAKHISEEVLHGPLTGFKWGDNFLSDICGNWSPANGAPKASPAPTIAGVKYEDLNADGVREPGEPGLAGWKIELFFEGKYVTSTTTGAGGAYSFRLDADAFPQLGEGAYTLKEESREGWHLEEAPGPIAVHYGVGEHNYGGNDFGNWRPATISGHKFDDSNVDGVWGSVETPLSSWGIQLSNGEEALTSAEGDYSFSVRPGPYTVAEAGREGWRQTAPGAPGSFERTVISGQEVEGLDFGNVCLGGVDVEPVDDSTGEPLAGLEVRLEEVSVPGILDNEPSLPRETTGTPDFDELLPGEYRVTAFLPEGVFTTDPDAILVEGRFAVVKEVAVGECATTGLPLHLFTQSTRGKATGGVRIDIPGGFATSGFEFMTRAGSPRGTLEYQDHATGLDLHTAQIEAIYVSGEVAWIWGKVDYEGALQRFRLRLVDTGEPGRDDRYELTVAPGYEAGQGETIAGGNVQIHS